MKNNYLDLKHFTYDDISNQAKYFDFDLNNKLTYGEFDFYCPGWSFEIKEVSNNVYNIIGKSSFANFEFTSHDLKALYRKSMLNALDLSFQYSNNISNIYFIFMLFHMWNNYIYFTAIYHGAVFGNSIIKAGKNQLIWDNREKEFGFSKGTSLFGRKSISTSDHKKIIEIIERLIFSDEAEKGYRSRIISAETSGKSTYLHEELSPKFKKELEDEKFAQDTQLAKKQISKKYEGFSMQDNSRWGYFYYKRNGKVIVTDYERGSGQKIIITKSELEKWTYPAENYLSTDELEQMKHDLIDFETKNHLEIVF